MDLASAVPTLELLYTSEFELGAPLELGPGTRGLRRVVPITGGKFEGPRLSGTLLAGSADWQLVRADGVVEADARYALLTDQGACVTVHNTGLLVAPGNVLLDLAQGIVPSPTAYYFRTRPIFDTADPSLSWLNQLLAVAVGEIREQRVIITVYRVT